MPKKKTEVRMGNKLGNMSHKRKSMGRNLEGIMCGNTWIGMLACPVTHIKWKHFRKKNKRSVK
jgi:hypothetical protein